MRLLRITLIQRLKDRWAVGSDRTCFCHHDEDINLKIGMMDGDDPGGDRSKKKTATKSTIIDHTYYDYSTRELSELLPPDSRRNAANDRQKGRVTFPMKLHNIVSNPKYRHIIRWMPHGRSWKIIDKELLASVVCRENFNHENFDSINRSINGWGFKVSLPYFFIPQSTNSHWILIANNMHNNND